MVGSVLFVLIPAAPAGAAIFRAGDRVEAAPTVSTVWLPCVVTEAIAGGYRVRCTSGDKTSDWTVGTAHVRAATGQAGAAEASRPAAGNEVFETGRRVDAAPFGASGGWYPCTVVGVDRSGNAATGYTVECEGLEGAQKRLAIGAGPQWIRAETAATASQAAQRANAAAASREAARPASGAAKAPPSLVPLPGPAAVKPGSYACATFSGGRLQQQPGLSHAITGTGTYRDSDGKSGTFAYDAATASIAFHGGSLDGTRALYQEKGRPR